MPMRVLITIPHYFDSQLRAAAAPGPGYGSQTADVESRVAAVTHCLRSLVGLYGGPQERWLRSGDQLQPHVANEQNRVELDIVLCTVGEAHLLQQVIVPAGLYRQHACDCEPLWLGYECHRVLREGLGAYHMFGYAEDDLIWHDADLFAKLAWFNTLVGDGTVLQPNRYEMAYTTTAIKKIYIDFDFDDAGQLAGRPSITGTVLGRNLRFVEASNPHAGCFFLNERQMAHWAKQDYFLDRSTRFVGPLESAATLGLRRTFAVYKAAPEHASFVEVQHYGQRWSRRLPHVRLPPNGSARSRSS